MTAHDCHTVQDLFSQYLDGDLDNDEKKKIDDALAGCNSCRSELEDLKRTLGRLGNLKHSAPPAFVDGVRDQIRKRSRGRFFGKRNLLFGRVPFEWISFVMILAMLVYYIVFMRSMPTDVSPAP